MRLFIALIAVFLLAGCSPADKMLEESTPKKTTLKSEGTQASQQQAPPQATPPQSQEPMYQNSPNMIIDTSKKYVATLTTSQGVIEIELNAANTPITVNNFVFLAKEKFYDGVIFHRTIPDFMIQGGDPTGTGSGGPGYQFADEQFSGEYTRGTVAMANAGPNTNGSQFFIMHKDTPLPKNYVIFGKVTNGLEVVDAIATAPTQPGGEGSRPLNPVVIESVTIHEE
jgi:cyclophilin family peptidyl-prolyl cis-trans isomerase